MTEQRQITGITTGIRDITSPARAPYGQSMSDLTMIGALRNLPQINDPAALTGPQRSQLSAAADLALAQLRAQGRLAADAPDDHVGVAICARGELGLVVSYGPVTYPDGTGADAYRGWHLKDLARRWSSRRPRWLIAPRADPRPQEG